MDESPCKKLKPTLGSTTLTRIYFQSQSHFRFFMDSTNEVWFQWLWFNNNISISVMKGLILKLEKKKTQQQVHFST